MHACPYLESVVRMVVNLIGAHVGTEIQSFGRRPYPMNALQMIHREARQLIPLHLPLHDIASLAK